MIRRVLALLLFVGLAACSGFQTLEAGHDFGPPPTGIEEKIKAADKYILKDPDSAIYDFSGSTPRRAYTNAGLAVGGGVNWSGWVVYYRVNAKNSYGAYTGFEVERAFFSNNQIHRWQYPNSPFASFTLVD